MPLVRHCHSLVPAKNPENPGKTLENSGKIQSFHQKYPLVNIQKTMENHHCSWENPLLMAIFNSYVELPEGIRTRCHVFYSVTCEKTEIVSICFYMKWLDVWFHPKEKCKNYKYPSIPTNGGGMAVKMVLNTMKWWLKGAYTLITLQKWSQVIKNKEIVFSGFQGPQDVFNWKRTWKKNCRLSWFTLKRLGTTPSLCISSNNIAGVPTCRHCLRLNALSG